MHQEIRLKCHALLSIVLQLEHSSPAQASSTAQVPWHIHNRLTGLQEIRRKSLDKTMLWSPGEKKVVPVASCSKPSTLVCTGHSNQVQLAHATGKRLTKRSWFPAGRLEIRCSLFRGRGKDSRFFTCFCGQAYEQDFLGKAKSNHRTPLGSEMQESLVYLHWGKEVRRGALGKWSEKVLR